jgi:hypothetical protein
MEEAAIVGGFFIERAIAVWLWLPTPHTPVFHCPSVM